MNHSISPQMAQPMGLDPVTFDQNHRSRNPTSSAPHTPVFSARPPSPESIPTHPNSSSSFLTALAAQERKVLELKEEVQKAEAELGRLKKQWAFYETSTKRDDSHHLEQLQPLRPSVEPVQGESPNDELRPGVKTMDYRNRMGTNTKTPQRTVFSGSKHTRELSLLSPKETLSGGASRPLERVTDAPKPQAHEKFQSLNDGTCDIETQKEPSKDLILETGKQLVGEFRQSVWTFIEDLRQVTVGDEAASAIKTRIQQRAVPQNAHQRQIQVGKGNLVRESMADKERGVKGRRLTGKSLSTTISNERPITPIVTDKISQPAKDFEQAEAVITTRVDFEEDSWDNWDTPKKLAPSKRCDTASSTDTLNPSPTNISSARTSLSSPDATICKNGFTLPNAEPNEISSWRTLSPHKLTKTAAMLMNEWEKNLASTVPFRMKDSKAD